MRGNAFPPPTLPQIAVFDDITLSRLRTELAGGLLRQGYSFVLKEARHLGIFCAVIPLSNVSVRRLSYEHDICPQGTLPPRDPLEQTALIISTDPSKLALGGFRQAGRVEITYN